MHVLHAAAVPAMRLGLSGRIDHINPYFERLTGWQSSELLGHDAGALLLPGADRARLHALLQPPFTQSPLPSRISGLVCRDGRVLAIEWQDQVVAAHDRVAAGLLCVGRELGATELPGAARPPAEQRYRNFFEAGLVGMAITMADKRWGQFNQRLCDMLGYSEAQMRELTWSELTHPDDLAADVTQFERLMAGQSDGYEMDKRFIRKDGQVLHTAIAVRCERDARGAAVCFYATVEDLSARKLAESALRENEQRLQSLLDNISCGVIVHGPDTHIIDANPAACRVTGLTLDQMRGKVAIDPYWCFLEEDGSTMPLERYPVPQVLARDSAVSQLVLGVRRPDRERPSWVQVDAYPFRDELGCISQIVVTFADITELKLAEDGARRLNRSLRVLSSCNFSLIDVRDETAYLDRVCEAVVAAGGFLLSAVFLANRDAEKSARIVSSAGPGAAYLQAMELSWDGDQPSGRGPFGVAVRTGLTQVNQDWRTSATMLPWREAAARHGFQSSIALPLSAANEIIGVLSLYAAESDAFNREEVPPLEELARNISVGIETLRTRQQRDMAEAASRAKSEFLANMSHEIRTPLNAIVGLNYLMRRDGVTAEQAARLEKIDGASQHLLALINDILDLSKIEARQVQLDATNFHLAAVLDAVASIIAESARAKGLAVHTDADAVPVWLRGDPTRLRQALLNLAGNAVKFTQSGSIALRAKLLDARDDELHLRFSVDDTGIGITAEEIPRLFQAFEQADASITRKFGGTGLGLAITKRLAELMGGECGVQSEPGVGSTFWFTARLHRGHGALPAHDIGGDLNPETLLQQRHRGVRILVAEDNAVNQEILLSLLHGVGLDPHVACDGQEAVLKASSGRYGLVLMDMQMPVMGGLEATRAIRALPGWQVTPILALTANAFDEDRRACRASGMDDFIVKPVDVNALYATILHWLDRAGEVSGPQDEGSLPRADTRT